MSAKRDALNYLITHAPSPTHVVKYLLVRDGVVSAATAGHFDIQFLQMHIDLLRSEGLRVEKEGDGRYGLRVSPEEIAEPFPPGST